MDFFFFMLCILYHKIPWWPVQREREGRRKLVQLYIRNQGRSRGGGTVPWIVHREEYVVVDQSPSDWRKRRRREGEQRSESTEVSLCGQRVCCFFNCSSPRPPSLVPPGFDRSIGRNVTGPRHSRQSWWVRFLWDKGSKTGGTDLTVWF